MMGIRDKLLLVIGDGSINQWARDRELPPQTVHGWIGKDRVPRKGGMDTLVKATGIPEKWWLYGEGQPPIISKPYPVSTANPLITGSGQHNGLTVQSHSTTDIKVNDFFMMPKHDLRSTDEGHGHVIRSEQIVDHLAFKKEWLQMSLNVHNNHLALITVKGDSMEPTLRSDDLILTDISTGHIEDDSIYVLQFKNDLVLKRIQRKMNGSVVVKSDNPIYGQEEMDELAAQALPVVGRVIWYGRRI